MYCRGECLQYILYTLYFAQGREPVVYIQDMYYIYTCASLLFISCGICCTISYRLKGDCSSVDSSAATAVSFLKSPCLRRKLNLKHPHLPRGAAVILRCHAAGSEMGKRRGLARRSGDVPTPCLPAPCPFATRRNAVRVSP